MSTTKVFWIGLMLIAVAHGLMFRNHEPLWKYIFLYALISGALRATATEAARSGKGVRG